MTESGLVRQGRLKTQAQGLHQAADELERELQSFPLEGRNTRAWWAVNRLRTYADRMMKDEWK